MWVTASGLRSAMMIKCERNKRMVLKCSKCGEEKDSTGFAKNNSKKRGFSVWCKLCMREYYADNREKIAENRRKNRADNREKIADYSRKYRANNKEKIVDLHREYRANNKEKIVDYSRKYRADNKEKIADYRAANYEMLSDSYVNGLIRKQTGLSARETPEELTEFKRGQLLIHRKLKQVRRLLK